MKTIPRFATLLLPLAALLVSSSAVLAEETDPAADAPFKPKEYELSRYSKNFDKKSPFEFDPPLVAAEPETNHFDGVSLGSYCGNGNTMSVYLIVGKEKKRVTVYGDGSPFKKLDASGFRIIGLKRGANLSTTSVVLEKGGQQKEVRFEPETLTAKGSGAAGGPGNKAPVMVIGPDGKPIQRPRVLPNPNGGAVAPTQVYQAPPAFNPLQTNGPGGAGGNQAANQQALQQQQNAMSVQQQVEQLRNVNKTSLQLNGTATMPPTTFNSTVTPTQHRRVVLPTVNQ